MGGLSLDVIIRTSAPADGYLNISDNSGEEEGRMKRQTSVPSIEPGPSDWESSAPSTRPLLRTKVCLPILPYVLSVVVG